MSDSEDSTVTYTAVSSPFGGLSDIGSPGVDGPLVMPKDLYAYVVAAFHAPPSPNYVSGPEYPPLLEFIPEPVYPEFMILEDDVLPAEEQPLPTAVSPTADSPGYVPESDPEEDPEEDDDEDPKEDPSDYPTDRDDDNEEEEEPFGDETDDKEEDDDDEEEEEHPAPADSVPHLYIVLQLGYPSDLRHPSDVPPSGTPPILPIPLSTSSPSLLLPSTDHGADRPEVCLPPRKRLCFAFGPREIRRDPEREVGYGITYTLDEMLEDMPGAPATDEIELGQRMTNFVTTIRHDTYEIYVRLGEAHDERSLMSGQLNLLQRDRRAHAHTALLMEREARLSCEAWGRSMDASDLARSEVMALRTQVVAHQSEIATLRAADRARHAQLVEILRLMSTLQTQVTALQGQLGPARGPTEPEIPEEAGSSS
ncbi:hypothetical protein Tco_0370707 [Tanacetum coccineum]